MIKSSAIEVLPLPRCRLGEGILWDPREECLYWVDIEGKMIFRYYTESDHLDTWPVPERVGFVIPGASNYCYAGFESGLYQLHLIPGEDASIQSITQGFEQATDHRFNDGTLDNLGRIWAGNMDMNASKNQSSFFVLDGKKLHRVYSKFTITNGPAFDPNSDRCFFNESEGNHIYNRGIYVSSINANREASDLEPFVDYGRDGDHPDGMSIDSEGNLYVAIWGSSCVRIYAPDAHLIEEIVLPATNITKVAFGGPDLKTLYITSATEGLSETQLQNQPEAGKLFSCRINIQGTVLPLNQLI